MHPFLRILWNQPGLLIDHALAYADLARAEIAQTQAWLLRRLVAWVLAGILGLLALVMTGVAAMLALALDAMPLAVWCVPGVTALLAVVAVLFASRRRDAPRFAEIQRQFDADLKAFDHARDTA